MSAETTEIRMLRKALKDCVEAMKMQEGREQERLHIPQETALIIWTDAIKQAELVLSMKVTAESSMGRIT